MKRQAYIHTYIQWASLKRTHSLDPKDAVSQAKEVEHSVENIYRHTRQILSYIKIEKVGALLRFRVRLLH